jgi:phage shock protein PspC (stress-responsive transcriptional regulator)
MKKVVNINLNGRAYQVEEDGYEALRVYLDKTEKTLTKNPDRDEIIADIEQAIADKCETELAGGKNVVSGAGVVRVLEKIGPVHGLEDEHEVQDAEVVDSPRRLYRLPKDGSLVGVCAGLAAYFGTDVTVMRLIFVVLTFITQGFMIFIYILLAIAMPEAKKPEQVAAAYGRPGTAKEIMGRVKEVATDKDTVSRIGIVIDLVGRMLAKVIMVVSAVIFGALTMVWLWLLGAIGLGGARLSDELASLNGLKQVVFVTAFYLVIAVPFFIIVRALDRVGKNNDERPGRDTAIYGTLVALIVASTVVISAFFSVYTDAFGSYLKNHNGQLRIGSHSLCLDANRCDINRHSQGEYSE